MSNLHEFWFTSRDGLRVSCKRWDSRGPTRSVLQIAHGMGEHSGRCCELIEALQQAGLVVYANDHRGHGRTVGSPEHFGQQLEGVRTLIDCYRNAGVRNISHDFYPGARHEMLNELNRGKVCSNLLAWLSAGLGNQSPH